MSHIYSLKVVKNGVTIQRKQIATGSGKGGDPLVLPAGPDLTYLLQDESGGKPVAKIHTQFAGRDLRVVMDDGEPGPTQVVLQNFADFQSSSALATVGQMGEWVVFKTDAAASLGGTAPGWTTWVAPGVDDGSALSLSSPLVWAGGLWLLRRCHRALLPPARPVPAPRL